MSKTVTLRLNEEVYALFKACAESDNRTLSNFIETTALRFIREYEFVDEFEMAEINDNVALQRSLKRAHQDVKVRRGRTAENV